MPSRVEHWEKRSEVPLLLLALAFLVAYAWPVLDPHLEGSFEGFLTIVSWTVWAAFSIDFMARLAMADRRGDYALRHWYDVLLILVPLLRPLRLLRVLAFARILNRSMASNLIGRVSIYVIGTAIASVGLAAITVLDAERGASDANINSIGDALWWACTTVTTVGYGDHYPITGQGRVVAVALMVVGIAVVGTVTATVAAWLVANVDRQAPAE